MLTEAQISYWQKLQNDMLNDEKFMRFNKERDARRNIVRQEMLELLEDYLQERVDSDFFRSTFQQKTATDWDVFGLKGFSGAMFLNMLINNIPDRTAVAEQLRLTLPVPADSEEGLHRLQSFMDFLSSLLETGQISKRRIQPAHSPFFFSAWWHLQSIEDWPIYYISGRKALQTSNIYDPTENNPIEDYFAFREIFIALSEALKLSAWHMEHLCAWHEERHIKNIVGATDEIDASQTPIKEDPILIDSDQTPAATMHTQIQYMLAKIGQHLGCQVWIASDNRNKYHQNERLGDLSIDELPYLGLNIKSQRIIEYIDVLWLTGSRQIEAAFEIEHSTSIYSGLLRMSDLKSLTPNIKFNIYIVTPDTRLDDVKAQLSRPTFQYLELHKECGFFSFERLIKESESILNWATESSAIGKLAQYVDDVNN